MPAAKKIFNLAGIAEPLTRKEGQEILDRDHYRCQYCGLDGMVNFENSLVMTVDFVMPRARKGKKDPANLVAACRPCNLLKGEQVFPSFEAAKAHVLKRRAELHDEWASRVAKHRTQSAAS
jgi:5-methylcytosine-specific restriction endonuclease McrA